MSKNLSKSISIDVCADCGHSDAPWASINRGVQLCDECCSVHLSLGRHVSQIKHLKKGSWCPQQLKMLQQLIQSGCNHIWEYTLLDPSQNRTIRKKPSAKDSIHPSKSDFIKAKYQLLSFTNKPRDSERINYEDCSKQLHSSVRTGNLETSLRLLASGADPNYIHPDKGTRVLHVASNSNQVLQVELLLVYGADPSIFDNQGKTPLDIAKSNNLVELSERLIECQYELTDGLAYYLCKRKPDHKSGHHFIDIEVSDGLDLTETAKGAKKKLQALSNHLFEELALDVYDEVDRRENVEIWSLSQPCPPIEKQVVLPFLPANPDFSATRNQGRQKLAKFSRREFTTLMIDILNDAKRRYCSVSLATPSPSLSFPLVIVSEKPTLQQQHSLTDNTNLSNNSFHEILLPQQKQQQNMEQIYDQVYSESDYAMIGENLSSQLQNIFLPTNHSNIDNVNKNCNINNTNYDNTTSANTFLINGNDKNPKASFSSSASSSKSNSSDETAILKKSLLESQQQSQQLLCQLEKAETRNQNLLEEISVLKATIERLRHENRLFKSLASSSVLEHPLPPSSSSSSHFSSSDSPHHSSSQNHPHLSSHPHFQHPSRWTLVERASDNQKPIKTELVSPAITPVTTSLINQEFPSPPQELLFNSRSVDLDFRNPNFNISLFFHLFLFSYFLIFIIFIIKIEIKNKRNQWHSTELNNSLEKLTKEHLAVGRDGGMLITPTQEDVVRRTDRITKALQELFQLAQENKYYLYSRCSEKIQLAVNDMMQLFPQKSASQVQLEALRHLDEGSRKIKDLCLTVSITTTNSSSNNNNIDLADPKLRTQRMIQTAYDIAKAAKQLVMTYEE